MRSFQLQKQGHRARLIWINTVVSAATPASAMKPTDRLRGPGHDRQLLLNLLGELGGLDQIGHSP